MSTDPGQKPGEIIRVEDRRASAQQLPTAREFNPIDLLRAALDRGATMEQLEKFTEIAERWKAAQAREAYAAAMAQAHASPPQIIKNKRVQFSTKAGDKMDYRHATHDEVTGKVGAWLAAFGFSHAWRTEQKENLIYVTCTVTHALGHSEAFTMFGSPDTSGLKSALQAVASTTTFLQRYTLLGATGLSSAEMRDADDDAGKRPPPEPAPEGYESWLADMEAKASDGLTALTATWGASKPAFRRYVVKYNEDWWTELKDKAREIAP